MEKQYWWCTWVDELSTDLNLDRFSKSQNHLALHNSSISDGGESSPNLCRYTARGKVARLKGDSQQRVRERGEDFYSHQQQYSRIEQQYVGEGNKAPVAVHLTASGHLAQGGRNRGEFFPTHERKEVQKPGILQRAVLIRQCVSTSEQYALSRKPGEKNRMIT